MILDQFIDLVSKWGLEYFRWYYAVYPATVVDVKDPDKVGRIRILCPDAGQSEEMRTVWVRPVFQGAGVNRGLFWPPEVGDSVRVVFTRGDPNKPLVYFGGWYGTNGTTSELPQELGYAAGATSLPVRRGWITRMGHRFLFGEESGQEFVELAWHKPPPGDAALTDPSKTSARTGESGKLRFEAAQVLLQDRRGNKITLDSANDKLILTDKTGNTVTLSSEGIVLDAGSRTVTVKAGKLDVQASQVLLGSSATEPIPLGSRLLNWLRTHTHPSSVGPTGTPLVPPTEALVSPSNRTR